MLDREKNVRASIILDLMYYREGLWNNCERSKCVKIVGLEACPIEISRRWRCFEVEAFPSPRMFSKRNMQVTAREHPVSGLVKQACNISIILQQLRLVS